MASRSAKKKSSMKEAKGKEHLYDAEGAPEAGEAMDETPGMKRGGKAKKHAHGGHVEGAKGMHRADKKPRHKRASGGRTPYTSGSSTTMPSEAGKTNLGHESERPG